MLFMKQMLCSGGQLCSHTLESLQHHCGIFLPIISLAHFSTVYFGPYICYFIFIISFASQRVLWNLKL